MEYYQLGKIDCQPVFFSTTAFGRSYVSSAFEKGHTLTQIEHPRVSAKNGKHLSQSMQVHIISIPGTLSKRTTLVNMWLLI
jgi:hypothetical protein